MSRNCGCFVVFSKSTHTPWFFQWIPLKNAILPICQITFACRFTTVARVKSTSNKTSCFMNIVVFLSSLSFSCKTRMTLTTPRQPFNVEIFFSQSALMYFVIYNTFKSGTYIKSTSWYIAEAYRSPETFTLSIIVVVVVVVVVVVAFIIVVVVFKLHHGHLIYNVNRNENLMNQRRKRAHKQCMLTK